MARIDPQDDLRELVEKNIEMTEKVFAEMQKIRRHFLWQSIKGWIKLALGIAVIVAGALATPYFVKRAREQIMPLTQNPDLQKLLENYGQKRP